MEKKKIKKFLNYNHIKYDYNKRFNDLRNKQPLPIDFVIYDKNSNDILLFLEFDGIQHFSNNNNNIYKYYTTYNFKIRRKNDKIKNMYCIKKNIPLLRISYKNINHINEILNEILFGNENKVINKYKLYLQYNKKIYNENYFEINK